MKRLIHPFLFLLLSLEASWSSERESKKRSYEENPGKSSKEKSKKQKTDLEKLAEKSTASENLFPEKFTSERQQFILEERTQGGKNYNHPPIYWIKDHSGKKNFEEPHLTISEGKPGESILQMHVTFGHDSKHSPSVGAVANEYGKITNPNIKGATQDQIKKATEIFRGFLLACRANGSLKNEEGGGKREKR